MYTREKLVSNQSKILQHVETQKALKDFIIKYTLVTSLHPLNFFFLHQKIENKKEPKYYFMLLEDGNRLLTNRKSYR